MSLALGYFILIFLTNIKRYKNSSEHVKVLVLKTKLNLANLTKF